MLFREGMEGTPRFPSSAWLDDLRGVNARRDMHLAAHLCGPAVEAVLRGESAFVEQLHRDYGFDRFQLNATAANGAGGSMGAREFDGVARCAAAVPHVEFILQQNDVTDALFNMTNMVHRRGSFSEG